MSVVAALIEALGLLFTWPTFGYVLFGVILGIVVGALPGVGAALGMAIVLPLTIPLDPINAVIVLIGMYSGAMYGGSISAILVNVPGTGGAAATTIDGYPMSKNGEAVQALTISATASAIAGFFTVIVLILFSPVLIELVLAFGSPEYFLMAILGLSMITLVVRGSMIKGLTAGAFGLMVTTIGIAPNSPELRYTFDTLALYDGIDFIAALIGVFAIAEMIKLSTKEGGIASDAVKMTGSVVEGLKMTLSKPVLLLKSGLLGLAIGAIPGAGATVANFFAYGEAVRSSKDNKSFGKGNPLGVLASEASNNGSVGGSLVPTLSFGIPGSAATAVLLGGLLLHGIRPGPDLFDAELATTYVFFLALLIGNVFILLIGLSLVSRLGVLTKIDTNIIIPIVIVLAIIGGFTLSANWIDVWTLLALGVLGFFMVKYDYSIIAFLLGVILGPIAEENLMRSLQLSDGSYLIFVTKPLSLLIVILTLVVLFGPFVGPKIKETINQYRSP